VLHALRNDPDQQGTQIRQVSFSLSRSVPMLQAIPPAKIASHNSSCRSKTNAPYIARRGSRVNLRQHFNSDFTFAGGKMPPCPLSSLRTAKTVSLHYEMVVSARTNRSRTAAPLPSEIRTGKIRIRAGWP